MGEARVSKCLWPAFADGDYFVDDTAPGVRPCECFVDRLSADVAGVVGREDSSSQSVSARAVGSPWVWFGGHYGCLAGLVVNGEPRFFAGFWAHCVPISSNSLSRISRVR